MHVHCIVHYRIVNGTLFELLFTGKYCYCTTSPLMSFSGYIINLLYDVLYSYGSMIAVLIYF